MDSTGSSSDILEASSKTFSRRMHILPHILVTQKQLSKFMECLHTLMSVMDYVSLESRAKALGLDVGGEKIKSALSYEWACH